jgi:aspartate aminotransferase
VTYPAQIALAGATPVVAPTDPARPILTPEGLKKALSPRTKALVINSPAKPTGRAYAAEDLERLAPIIKDRNLWVVSDDIYECLMYGGKPFANVLTARPDLKDQVVVCHGVSKTYSMTGWRIGYMAAPLAVAQAAARVQSHQTSNPASVAQRAALAALTGPQECVAQMRAAFAARREKIMELMAAIPEWECPAPDGAFYVFPKVSALFGREIGGEVVRGSEDLARVFLAQALVATTPGGAFGWPDHLRLSYAVGVGELEKAFGRIRGLLAGRPPLAGN